MKEIQLTRGKKAIVDDDQYEILNKHKWYFNGHYAVRAIGVSRQNRSIIYMHQAVLGKDSPIDHINGNKLDNQIINLRFASPLENMRNRKDKLTAGVRWNGTSWRATIYVLGKQIHLGCFKTKEEAKHARLAGLENYWGDRNA